MELRTLALAILNDEQGINSKAFYILESLLRSSGDVDILDAVKCDNDRFYISEATAEALK